MNIASQLRQPAGTVIWLEFAHAPIRAARMHHFQSVGHRIGAEIQQQTFNAFNRQNTPIFLLRVKILKPGRQPAKRGRK